MPTFILKIKMAINIDDVIHTNNVLEIARHLKYVYLTYALLWELKIVSFSRI